MITEDYVSFEIAKLLKEKGFPLPSTNFRDWLCCMYDENQNIHWGMYDENWYFRITHQMAMKWLREVHNVHISTTYDYREETWNCDVEKSLVAHIEELVGYKTYEQAIEAALKYSLENLI